MVVHQLQLTATEERDHLAGHPFASGVCVLTGKRHQLPVVVSHRFAQREQHLDRLGVVLLRPPQQAAELEAGGVRRVSTGGLLASAAYGALVAGARELSSEGTSEYGKAGVPRDLLNGALGG